MLAALHVPMFGFTCLAFLMVSVVLAIATLLVFKSGEKGATKLGGFAGCMVGLGLVVIAGCMVAGTLVVMTLGAWNEAVRRGPVKSFEFHLDDGSRLHGSHSEKVQRDEPAELTAEDFEAGHELTGGMDPAPSGRGKIEIAVVLRDSGDAAKVIEWVREHVEVDLGTEWDTVATEEGELSRVTFSAELDSDEIARVRRDLEHDFPIWELPSGGKIEFRGPND